MHQGHLRDRLETHTKALYDRWVQFSNDKHLDEVSDPMKYQGLPLHQVAYFERCFQTNVNHLRDDGVALTVYKSRCHFDDTMHVNQFDHHLSFISNVPAVPEIPVRNLQSPFQTYEKHEAASVEMYRTDRLQLPGRVSFQPEDHSRQGIHVQDRLFKWFVVYDFEAMLVPIKESNSAKLTWTRHDPISVCSNVDGYTDPHCIVDPV